MIDDDSDFFADLPELGIRQLKGRGNQAMFISKETRAK